MKHATPTLLAALLLAAAAPGADEPAAAKPLAGPNGGKLLPFGALQAEFVVLKERKVAVNLFDAALKPVAPSGQQAAATAQAPSGAAKLEFDQAATGFTSKSALPDGDGYILVLQLRPAPGAKPENHRIKLDLAVCGGCNRAEYACTCEGHGH